MGILTAITICAVLLIVSPILIGFILCNGGTDTLEGNILYQYMIGFTGEIGLWGIISYPYILFANHSSFRSMCIIYMAAILLFIAVGLFISIKRHGIQFSLPRRTALTRIDKLCITLAIIVIGIQLARIVLSHEFEFSDEMAYVPLINDTIYMDRIFTKNYFSGEIDMSFVIKRGLAPWYYFLGCLSLLSGLHATFVCKVLMPAVILILFYIITILFGKVLFMDSLSERTRFLLLAAVTVEALWLPNVRFYLVSYPVIWGKAILSTISIPLIYMFLKLKHQDKSSGFRQLLLGVLLGAGAATFHINAIVYVTLEVVYIAMLNIYKSSENRLVICRKCIACELPLICQFAAYVFYTYIRK